ncbi:hypothetical protein M9H77_29243 [Catharanthus roseus]|uniref:Uncharacterized protein n=1 Tax=Catharanthus roseus TaxID=4058 RepID=A0ACC0AJ83_CATRO|nr:hypothetical protein M9H77_29243 [Catharanthus roseus]
MDWFSWLSKTSLDPSLVYDYAIVFSHNELEEDDIGYFNHEFLQSMGISIAKHRLEILKLARKEKRRIAYKLSPILWFLIAIKQTRNYIAKHVRSRVSQDDSTALSLVVPQRNYSSRWKAAMLQRNRKFMAAANNAKQGRQLLTYGNNANQEFAQVDSGGQAILMLTNGSPTMESPPLNNSFSSPKLPEIGKVDEENLVDDDAIESIRWESMFQDLKPT